MGRLLLSMQRTTQTSAEAQRCYRCQNALASGLNDARKTLYRECQVRLVAVLCHALPQQTRGLTTLLNASMNCSFTVSDKRTTAHVTTTSRLASCPLLMTHADRRSPRTLSSRFPLYFSTLSCPLSKPVDYLPLHQQQAIHAILDSLIGFVTSGNLRECAMCFEHSHGMKLDDTLCARCHKEACCPFLLVQTLTDIHALPVYRTACIATTANTTPTPARSRRNFTTSSTTSLRVRWRRCCAASPPVASSCG